MSWSVYLFRTTTGQLGPRVEPTTLTWDIDLNETESLDMTLHKNAIPQFDKATPFLDPWWGGVALLWNDVAIFAGPIVSRPTEDITTVRIAARGIRALLARRQAVRDMVNWSDIKKPDILRHWSTDGRENVVAPKPENSAFRNKSYPTLARLAVEVSLTKHGGELPIKFPVPYYTDKTDDRLAASVPVQDRPHYRRWAGYQGMNISVDAVLTELSELEQGPDIMFRPMLKGSRIYWDMWTGKNDTYPEISQDFEPIWDLTAAQGSIVNLSLQFSGSKQTNRAFAIGSGSDGAQPMAMSQDTSKIKAGYPLLESFETFTQFTKSGALVIEKKAQEMLRADDKPRHQLSGEVRTDGPPSIGTFWPGHYGTLITKGWVGLTDGKIRTKILAMSGDLSHNMKLSFQETEIL